MSDITVLTDHKSLIYFKTQAHLSRRQDKWMETLEHFNPRVEYKPGKELVTADALSRLMVGSVKGSDHPDPDWPMLFAGDISKDFPPGASTATCNMVLLNKEKFRMVSGTAERILKDGSTVPYISVLQRAETTLRYHCDLGHTRSRNLFAFMCYRVWWPSMLPYIEEVLGQCEVCEKFAPSVAPLKSVVPVPDDNPLKNGLWML